MKLSEAMRLGIMAIPPVHGPVFHRHGGQICSACAIGTPIYALYGQAAKELLADRDAVDVITEIFAEQWPWVMADCLHPLHPLGQYKSNLVSILISLYETHDWTREQIADWIATIEPADVPTVLDTEHTEVTA